MTTEIVSYSATEAAVADLETKYKMVVYDVTKEPGMLAARAAYKDINTHSITLEAARVKEKAESLAYGRKIDAEAKRISDKLDGLRLPIKAMIETETKRAQRELEESLLRAAQKKAAEEAAIKAAEEAKMAAERAEIAKAQAALAAAQKAAQDKIDADQRAARLAIEAEERAARAQREEADRVARQAREAEESKAKAIRDEEERRIKAEREKVESERRAVEDAQRKEREAAEAKAKAERDAKEAAERKEREAEEAKQRAVLREQAELMDGMAMLKTFVERFGKRDEFQFVVDAIKKYLRMPV